MSVRPDPVGILTVPAPASTVPLPKFTVPAARLRVRVLEVLKVPAVDVKAPPALLIVRS